MRLDGVQGRIFFMIINFKIFLEVKVKVNVEEEVVLIKAEILKEGLINFK